MDVLIVSNRAWELFPDGAPAELLANFVVIQNYQGVVSAGDVWNGSTFEAAPPEPPIVPSDVTMRQARLALLEQGLLATVDANMASATEADQIEWEYATYVYRDSALVSNMAASLGLTDTDIDNLFILAGTK